MDKDFLDFTKQCKLFETQLRNLRRDYQLARFDYCQSLEEMSARSYLQNKELSDIDKKVLSEKSHKYLSLYFQYLELREKYKLYHYKFQWLRGI